MSRHRNSVVTGRNYLYPRAYPRALLCGLIMDEWTINNVVGCIMKVTEEKVEAVI